MYIYICYLLYSSLLMCVIQCLLSMLQKPGHGLPDPKTGKVDVNPDDRAPGRCPVGVPQFRGFFGHFLGSKASPKWVAKC